MNIRTARRVLYRFAILLPLFAASCSVHQQPLQETLQNASTEAMFKLTGPVTVRARRAGNSLLRAGTHWQFVGTIPQGAVYRTQDQVVIVNSFNVHEGYIVVQSDMVVGYYLPIEQAFVKSQETPINLIAIDPQPNSHQEGSSS